MDHFSYIRTTIIPTLEASHSISKALLKSGKDSNGADADLVIMWSRNPHAKTPIPGKPSKSGLIGV
jgi:hypothetical protein